MTRALITVLIAVAATGAAGCMDSLHDYEDCVKIEEARCRLRASCDDAYPDFDLAKCVEYYGEYCRTREIDGPVGKTATDAEVNACVAAIEALPCDALDNKVDETNLLAECEFLWPKEDDDTETETEADAG